MTEDTINFRMSLDDLKTVKKIEAKWSLFRNLRNKKEFETGQEPGHITVLEREDMLQKLLDILFRIIWD